MTPDEIAAQHTALWNFREEVDVLWVNGVRSLVHRPTGIHVPAPPVVFENSKRQQYAALRDVLEIYYSLTATAPPHRRADDLSFCYLVDYESGEVSIMSTGKFFTMPQMFPAESYQLRVGRSFDD